MFCHFQPTISKTLKPILAVIYVVKKDNVEETCNLSFGSKTISLKAITLSRLTKKKQFWTRVKTAWSSEEYRGNQKSDRAASLNLRLLKTLTNLTQSHFKKGGQGYVWKVALETSSFVRFDLLCVAKAVSKAKLSLSSRQKNLCQLSCC